MVLTATGYVPIEANAVVQRTNADVQTGSIVAKYRLLPKIRSQPAARISRKSRWRAVDQ